MQRPRVVRARDAVGAVPATVEQRSEVHARDGAVFFHAGLDPHQRGVTPAVAVEHFLARERDLHGPTRDHGQLGRDDLVTEGVALAAEPASVGAGDDADPRRRELEHLGERAVDIVGRLRGAPQRHLPVGRPVGHRGVLFHREVRAALEEKRVLAHQVGVSESLLHVAELEVNQLVQVAPVAVVVDAGLGVGERVSGVGDRAQRLVLHGDAAERGGGRLLAGRGDGRHGIAHEPHLLEGERVLILTDREDPKRDREVLTRKHGLHTRKRGGSRRVDRDDAGVGMRAAQQLRVQHPGQEQVVRELRGARHFGRGVDLAECLADDAQVSVAHTASPAPARRARRACEPPPIRPPRRS